MGRKGAPLLGTERRHTDTTNQVPSLHLGLVSPVFRSHPQFHKIALICGPEKPVVGPWAMAQAGNSQCTQPGSQAGEVTLPGP